VQLGSTPEDIQAALNLCKGLPGCTISSYADEQSRVVILAPFILDSLLVTVGDFRNFVDETHYRTGAEIQGFAYGTHQGVLTRKDNGTWQNAVDYTSAHSDWPVVAVNFSDAEAYCRWRGKRLPTEDEWEYIARGPERHIFPWGDKVNLAFRTYPAAVGSGPAEGIAGLYRDMSGVVWQWVDTNVGEDKIQKGGSRFETNPANRRAAARRQERPDRPTDDSGFRCAANAAEWPDAQFWLDRGAGA
jgi:formylglycine-generating enzyme required for sulfatase activity